MTSRIVSCFQGSTALGNSVLSVGGFKSFGQFRIYFCRCQNIESIEGIVNRRLFFANKWAAIAIVSVAILCLAAPEVLAGVTEHMLAKNAEEEGLKLIYQQDYKGAIEALDKAISLDPDYALAYSFRACAYVKSGNYQKAIDDSTMAIKLDRKLWTPYCWRSEAYEKLGQPQRAIDEFRLAIDVDPENSSAYLGRADLYEKQGLHQKAIDDYSKVIELDPKHHDSSIQWGYVYYRRGIAYHNLGKDESEKSDLEQAAALGYKQVSAK